MRDAELHAKVPQDLGFDFDAVDASAPRDDPEVVVAIAFWDAWLDERNHGFPGRYEGIGAEDWPILARCIATSLSNAQAIDDPRILKHFTFQPRSTWLTKLRALFR